MENVIYIFAAVIPSVLFLWFVVYTIVLKTMSIPKIITTAKALKLVGVSIMSTDANIERDDALL